MDPPEELETPTTFGARLEMAIRVQNLSESRTGRDCGLAPGRMTRLLGRGKNPIAAPSPTIIQSLADYLKVSYEWLAIGRGPMRPYGWAPTPLDEARGVAQRNGARQDAIEAAIEKHRSDLSSMNAMDWLLAFNAEAMRLDRLGVPRPEEVEAAQRRVKRMAAKKARLVREHEAAAAQRAREQKTAPRTEGTRHRSGTGRGRA